MIQTFTLYIDFCFTQKEKHHTHFELKTKNAQKKKDPKPDRAQASRFIHTFYPTVLNSRGERREAILVPSLRFNTYFYHSAKRPRCRLHFPCGHDADLQIYF